MVHPFFDPALTSTFAEAAPRQDSTFELRYYNTYGRVPTIRATLAAMGANWKDTFVEDWDWSVERTKQPFGLMPILTETTADGKTLDVVETDAIERYLARKFDLMGDNIFEETLVNTYLCSHMSVISDVYPTFTYAPDPKTKAAALEDLITTTFSHWIQYHEKHLVANGFNGHYVGQRLSLADIKLYHISQIILNLTGEDLISEKLTPGIWNVRQGLEAIPSFEAWVRSSGYAKQAAQSKRAVGF